MLEVDHLEVRYGAIPALRGVNLRVAPREIVGVIGPNGAGKSTLLLAVAGGVRTHAGAISFEGRPMTGLSPDEVVRRGVALVPEGRRIFETLTVLENLQVGLSSRRRAASAGDEFEWVLEIFPALGFLLTSPAGHLSGGEQQQLAIARSLLARPKLLLVDEPSLGLGPLLVDRVFEVFRQLQAAGVTIVFVDQNAAKAIDVAGRLYLMQGGLLEELDLTQRVLAAIDSGELYFGRPVVEPT